MLSMIPVNIKKTDKKAIILKDLDYFISSRVERWANMIQI